MFILSQEEKKELLSIARKSLIYYLSNDLKPEIKDVFLGKRDYLKVPINLGICYWTKGEVRGSRIVLRKILSDAVIDAVILALEDSRFKPITLSEVPDTRIEMTLLSDEKKVILKENFDKMEINPVKGYMITLREKRGWFMPEVFNAIKFENFYSFLQKLSIEKAGFESSEIFDPDVKLEIFDVLDFVESKDLTEAISLIGPKKETKNIRFQDVIDKAILATEWIIRIQEEDGNISPIIHPFLRRKRSMDWSRLAFTGMALFNFGKILGKEAIMNSSKKAFAFIKKYFRGNSFKFSYKLIDIAYIGQLAILFEDEEIILECSRILSTEADPSYLTPITNQQIATFFYQIAKRDSSYISLGRKYSDFSKGQFEQEKNNESSEIVVYAELVHNFVLLFEITKDEKYFTEAKYILDWLLKYQKKDGSFKVRKKGKIANTRQTGKIIEVMALLIDHQKLDDYDKNYYRRSIKMALAWFFSMQYDEENSFFIDPKTKLMIAGGFRHTYLDADVWVDSAGHLLLGLSRLNLEKTDLLEYAEIPTRNFILPQLEKYAFDKKNKISMENLFFEKKFFFEAYIFDFIRKLFSNLPGFNLEMFQKFFGRPDHQIRNYLYLLGILKKRGLVKETDINKIISLVRFKGLPGFFESRLTMKSGIDCSGIGFSREWRKSLSQAFLDFMKKYPYFKESESLDLKQACALGGGFTKKEAILSGLYELIRRDALMNYCANRKAPKLIDFSEIKNKEFINDFLRSISGEMKIFSLYLDSAIGIPVIATLIKDQTGLGPLYSVGVGCNPNIMKALVDSHEKAWSNHYYLREKYPMGFQVTQENKEKINFLLNGEKISLFDIRKKYPERFINKKEELRFAIQELKKKGKDFAVRFSIFDDEILKKVGFMSAKVTVPGLVLAKRNEEEVLFSQSEILYP